MVHLLLVLVPLGLAAAVSPVMLTEQTVLLGGPHGRRAAASYVAGTAVVLAVLIGAVLVVGSSLSLPTAPHLDATLDLVVGCALLLGGAALLVWHLRRRPEGRHDRAQPGAAGAFAFGTFSMATNFTTLALVLPAAKEIAADPVDTWERFVAALLLVTLACLPAWGPLLLQTVAPGSAGRALDRVAEWIRKHGALLGVGLLGSAGVFLVVRGIVRMAGL